MRQKQVSLALPFSEFLFQEIVAKNPEARSAVKNYMMTAHLKVDT
jgi:hypothetical protein